VGHLRHDVPLPGVAKIDVLKRSHVISDIERRLIDELRKREAQIVSALSAPTTQTEFEFGRICGMYQEHQVIQRIFEHCLNEGDPTERHDES
jgi:hypothetical protein